MRDFLLTGNQDGRLGRSWCVRGPGAAGVPGVPGVREE